MGLLMGLNELSAVYLSHCAIHYCLCSGPAALRAARLHGECTAGRRALCAGHHAARGPAACAAVRGP